MTPEPEELMFVDLKADARRWRTNIMSLAGDMYRGALPGLPASAPAVEAKEAFEGLLRTEFGVGEAIIWGEADDGWGATFHGTGMLPEHVSLVATARLGDTRWVRALGAHKKRVVDTGPIEAEHITRVMRRRARHLHQRSRTFGPIDRYVADLDAARREHENLVHVICIVDHASSRTVHSALLTEDRSRVVAVLDHWLPLDEPAED